MALPVLLVVTWYSWASYAHVDRYGRGTAEAVPWSAELFQIALHDELTRDLRRGGLEEPQAGGRLPTFALSLTRDNLDALSQQLYSGTARQYVKGYAQKDGAIHDIRLRYRGSKPWHWIGPQKSMKLRLEKGDLIDGTRVFNLLNEPTAFGMEEQIILDIARDLGLLTPDYHAVRVRVNNSDQGVYKYAAQPVEGLLRRGRRIPGHVYSGDSERIDPERGVGDLFFSEAGWQQVATQGDGGEEDIGPLEELLSAVAEASHLEFSAFAAGSLDVERYALFDALDVVFAGNEHDYLTNHKFYFDPYRGLFEPVAWSYRGFQYEPELNLVDHPLLIRLKMTPGYLARRNRAVYALLMNEASVPSIRGRADRLFETMAPDLSTDPYWDAYKLLPRVTRFHRFMVRPMSMEKWSLAMRAEIFGYGRRVRFLLDELEKPNVHLAAIPASPGLTRAELTVGGHASHRVREVSLTAPCDGVSTWRADTDRDGQLGEGDPLVATGRLGSDLAVTGHDEVEPGIVLVPRPDPRPDRGLVKAVQEARVYSYLISSPCAPTSVAMVIDNHVTGGSSRLICPVQELSQGLGPDEVPDALPNGGEVPQLIAGERSPHLWDSWRAPISDTLEMGPGRVSFAATRVFPTNRHVIIHPGTRLELGPAVSLIFRGRVDAAGTRARPIVIAASQPEREFGGIVIQGPATRGSSLVHLRVQGGSHVVEQPDQYPSLLSVYDTADILVESAEFTGAGLAEDVLHTTYVRGLRLHEIHVQGAPVDGVDLEFTEGEIRGLRVTGSGDDCLDLMGVDLRVSDSVLQGCRGNAISAGEESDVVAHSMYVSDSKTGVLAKNGSRIRLTRSLIFRTETALRTRRRDIHYTGESRIGASNLYVASTGRLIDEAAGSHIDVEQVYQALPTGEVLHHLRRDVLGLASWGQFARLGGRDTAGTSQ